MRKFVILYLFIFVIFALNLLVIMYIILDRCVVYVIIFTLFFLDL